LGIEKYKSRRLKVGVITLEKYFEKKLDKH
jgi:hypothetical protein